MRALALLLVAAACAGRPAERPAAESARGVAAGDTLRLAVGARVSVDAGRLTVRVDSLLADSRCPVGKACVWAGDAAVALTLVAGDSTAAVTLHTGVEPRAVTVRGYTVALLGVAPRPGEPPAPAVVSLRTDAR